MNESEAGLVDSARSGDPQALEQLLEQQQGRILRFARKMCRMREDAEDVLQDTLVAMARTLPGFRGAASVSTWAFTIARSFCIKKRRRGRNVQATVALHDDDRVLQVPDSGKRPDELAASAEIQDALDRAIAELPAAHREVLLLRDVEGLTAPEVAEVLGVRVEAVKSRLHRARVAVRERLAPLLAPATAPEPGCPDIVGLFSRHLEGQVDGTVCARMEQHLSGCTRCSTACDSLRQVLDLCRSSALPEVPQSVQDSLRDAIRQCRR